MNGVGFISEMLIVWSFKMLQYALFMINYFNDQKRCLWSRIINRWRHTNNYATNECFLWLIKCLWHFQFSYRNNSSYMRCTLCASNELQFLLTCGMEIEEKPFSSLQAISCYLPPVPVFFFGLSHPPNGRIHSIAVFKCNQTFSIN